MNLQHQHILRCFTMVKIGRWCHLKDFSLHSVEAIFTSPESTVRNSSLVISILAWRALGWSLNSWRRSNCSIFCGSLTWWIFFFKFHKTCIDKRVSIPQIWPPPAKWYSNNQNCQCSSFAYTTLVLFLPIRGQDFTVIWSISHLTQHGSILHALMHMWHKLVYTLVFVDMKFNPQQASDKFHINENAGIN